MDIVCQYSRARCHARSKSRICAPSREQCMFTVFHAITPAKFLGGQDLVMSAGILQEEPRQLMVPEREFHFDEAIGRTDQTETLLELRILRYDSIESHSAEHIHSVILDQQSNNELPNKYCEPDTEDFAVDYLEFQQRPYSWSRETVISTPRVHLLIWSHVLPTDS
eukprot:6178588-Pleurochrysis_carterae.AAC.1